MTVAQIVDTVRAEAEAQSVLVDFVQSVSLGRFVALKCQNNFVLSVFLDNAKTKHGGACPLFV